MLYRHRKYKIGLIVDSVGNKSTGIGYYTKGFIEALLKHDKKNLYYFIDYKKTNFNQKNLHLVKNPFKILKTYLWHLFLPLRLKDFRYDYILDFSGAPHFLFNKMKEILVVHDLTLDLLPNTHPIPRIFFNKLFFRNNMNGSYKILVNSTNTKNDLIKYYNVPEKKIMAVFIPITQKIIEKPPEFKINFPYILNINTLEPRKNISSLVLAFNKLKQNKQIPHKLIISGTKGWKYKYIFELVKRLRLEKDVIFTSYVTEEEKKYLFNHADVFVYPSFYEGFGIPVLEAMMNKCPVVTSNCSSLPEIGGNAVIRVNPYNIDQIAHAMLRILESGELRRQLVLMGYNRSKKYTDRKIIKVKIRKFMNFVGID